MFRTMTPKNLYVHFPFCRAKCAYCALFSRAGVDAIARDEYVRQLARAIDPAAPLATVYFGGGSPALCDLRPLFKVLNVTDETEFTVELHPLDVTDDLLLRLRDGGVNRISMGLQSLDDETLRAMGRLYTADEAAHAFSRIRRVFDNAGVDLIVGFPGDPCRGFGALASWGLSHASVYTLQNERHLEGVPSDAFMLDKAAEARAALDAAGLSRYEISNYAVPSRECRHNLAVWCGEDYRGLGAGACGREGLRRTQGVFEKGQVVYREETLDARRDRVERAIFRLRTRRGLDATLFPEWEARLLPSLQEGLLVKEGTIYRLTPRGAEVCDAILADLV